MRQQVTELLKYKLITILLLELPYLTEVLKSCCCLLVMSGLEAMQIQKFYLVKVVSALSNSWMFTLFHLSSL